jgi:polyhydroxybutyrate depolymerase
MRVNRRGFQSPGEHHPFAACMIGAMRLRSATTWRPGRALVVLWLAFAFTALAHAAPRGKVARGTVETGGATRGYLLYVPRSLDPAKPAPLVITFHGFAEWPAHVMDISGWNALAEKHGFLVAYPSGSGLPLRWRTHGRLGSADDPTTDVLFVSDLIDKLEREHRIDPARIYANGLSNGAGMAAVLARRLSGRIAAVGGVSGAYTLPPGEPKPARAVPLIVFHGTADPIVPYEGGRPTRFAPPMPSVAEWVKEQARLNGCGERRVKLPASGAVSGVKYTDPAGRADVVLYTITGAGHTWPGGGEMPRAIVGENTHDISATQTMWDFFKGHPMRGRKQ